MSRLLIHVEGQTEETFVKVLLAPHLNAHGFVSVSARLLGNARQRDRRGGIRAWSAVRLDFMKHLRGDEECFSTTMIDYYALPQTGQRAWPGREAAGKLPYPQKAATVENALLSDISREMGGAFDPKRFIPHVMMHEFEGLLFSDCEKFAIGINRLDLAARFQSIRDEFSSPEEINDSAVTAPSKRVETLVPGYQKPLFGVLAALEIGLDAIREECPHFRQWLSHLEILPKA